MAPLAKTLSSRPPLCHEYKLAFCAIPNKSDFAEATDEALEQILMSANYLELNTEYKAGNVDAVSVLCPSEDGTKIDVGKYLVENGYALVEARREGRFKELVIKYPTSFFLISYVFRSPSIKVPSKRPVVVVSIFGDGEILREMTSNCHHLVTTYPPKKQYHYYMQFSLPAFFVFNERVKVLACWTKIVVKKLVVYLNYQIKLLISIHMS